MDFYKVIYCIILFAILTTFPSVKTLQSEIFIKCVMISKSKKLQKSIKINKPIPLVVTTWNFKAAADTAWSEIYKNRRRAVDAIVRGCSKCEELQCDNTVGFGGSPDEHGETTLDALIMDGQTMDVGSVGGLRNVKSAISVAQHVLENTHHTLLVGDLATDFAIKMGFKNESLQTEFSIDLWRKWKTNNCQPNFWKNVTPNPLHSCGPYKPSKQIKSAIRSSNLSSNEDNHDTVGMIAIDNENHIAAGTSSNGARNKIPGRVGDSPIPGAGAYADDEVGAAAATGDGDIMMRFLPSFLAVEQMRNGISPSLAAKNAIQRIVNHYKNFSGAVIACNKAGEFGAACNGFNKTFPFYVSNPSLQKSTLYNVKCS